MKRAIVFSAIVEEEGNYEAKNIDRFILQQLISSSVHRATGPSQFRGFDTGAILLTICMRT